MTSPRASFLQSLPYERRVAILAQNGNDPAVAKALGIGAPEQVAPCQAKPKRRGAGTKTSVAGIVFDSRGEAEAFRALRDLFPAVFAHPRIALCDDDAHGRGARFEPDFIVALKVNEDGTFLGACVDYKAERDGKAFAERDWKKSARWLRASTGIVARKLTDSAIAAMRAAMVAGRSIADALMEATK